MENKSKGQPKIDVMRHWWRTKGFELSHRKISLGTFYREVNYSNYMNHWNMGTTEGLRGYKKNLWGKKSSSWLCLVEYGHQVTKILMIFRLVKKLDSQIVPKFNHTLPVIWAEEAESFCSMFELFKFLNWKCKSSKPCQLYFSFFGKFHIPKISSILDADALFLHVW